MGSLKSEVGSLTVDEGVDGKEETGGLELINEARESEVREVRNEESETSKDKDKDEDEDGGEDAMERLEKLRLGVEEPEPSEEQLRNNSQSQKDEVIQLILRLF